jgi:hypothetical protein
MSVLREYDVTMREGDILTNEVSVNFSSGNTFVEVNVPSCLKQLKGRIKVPNADNVGASTNVTFAYEAKKTTVDDEECSLVYRGGRAWDESTWYYIKANIEVLPKRNREPKILSLNTQEKQKRKK